MTEQTAATDIKSLWRIFNPTNLIDANSDFYVQRSELNLRKLTFDLQEGDGTFKGFLCGHVGSGKTTELRKLYQDSE